MNAFLDLQVSCILTIIMLSFATTIETRLDEIQHKLKANL